MSIDKAISRSVRFNEIVTLKYEGLLDDLKEEISERWQGEWAYTLMDNGEVDAWGFDWADTGNASMAWRLFVSLEGGES